MDKELQLFTRTLEVPLQWIHRMPYKYLVIDQKGDYHWEHLYNTIGDNANRILYVDEISKENGEL